MDRPPGSPAAPQAWAKALLNYSPTKAPNVAVVDIQTDLGEQVADRISQRGSQAIFTNCDITRGDQVRDSIEQTVDRFDGLQIIVNCGDRSHWDAA